MKDRRGFGTSLLIGLGLVWLTATAIGLSERRALPDEEVWWLAIPDGYELDGQVTTRGWAVFWRAPDGTSTRLAGGR
jgi:hypothetical protein